MGPHFDSLRSLSINTLTFILYPLYLVYMNPDEKKRTQLIQKAARAVVSISIAHEKKEHISSYTSLRPSFLEKLSKKTIDTEGGGSGFFVHSSGIIVTNTHVVPHSQDRYLAATSSGKIYEAQVVGTDDVHDVAFLKIGSSEKFPYLTLGNSLDVVLGQSVYAIGNVLGYFQNTVSSGIVSGLTRSIEAMNEERKEELHGLIQTDAAINPGNSGGPLIDSSGKVIGINSAAVPHAENIAFAIPIHVIKGNLSDILKYGKIKRAYLGVRHIIINTRIQRAFNLPVEYGVWVMSPTRNGHAVIPNSPAQKAGVREKDIIAEIEGKKLGENFTLEEFLEDAKGGQKVTLTVLRGTKRLQIKAMLVEKK